MERDQAIKLIMQLLGAMKQRNSSDLFITAGFPPAVKIDGQMTPLMDQPLTPENSAMIMRSLMNDRQLKEFEATNECNFAIQPPTVGRFRVNAFIQMGRVGGVLRVINTTIPDFDEMGLPPILKELVSSKRGLVLMVGATGSGKSTTLAAMMGYRNRSTKGHIVTIEDPVEFVHPHDGCIITQREVGADTHSWDNALKNTLRQAPDVILIGEIRTRETMEYAINFAETGHLVLSTLHANSANQALDRIINFFPEERREQLLMDLSLNLRAILSQRLVRREGNNGRAAAIEILINSPLISDLIFKGDVHSMKEIMGRSREQGMITFDQCLFDLYDNGTIAYEEALRNADSQNELRLRVKLESKRGRQNLMADEGLKALKLVDDTQMNVLKR